MQPLLTRPTPSLSSTLTATNGPLNLFAALAVSVVWAGCGTLPAEYDTTPNVGLTSDARRLDVGHAELVTPQGHATYCGDGSTGCVWTQHDSDARCEWHAAHSEGEWWCKVDAGGEVTETLCAVGSEFCYPPTVVDSWVECGRRAEAYACGDDLAQQAP